MKPDGIGLYLHVPFCRRKCGYCDFCSFPDTTPAVRDAYADALIREMRAYAPLTRDVTVDTVFFGGGTPTMLTRGQFARLLAGIRESFCLSPGAEITCEANPAAADLSLVADLRELGVNRLSVGVQSFSDPELAALGRLHTAAEAYRFLSGLRGAGYDRFSLDLMYAIPGQTPESWQHTLTTALSLSPPHLSAYSLKVEEGTPFFARRDALNLPDADGDADLYDACVARLTAAGYNHYEISNYAAPGCECRHNLHYWREEPYIGLGVAAHSFFGGYRYGCDRDLAAYLRREFHPAPHGEAILPATKEYEAVMLGLRLREGIREDRFRARFGHGFREIYGARLAPLIPAGLVQSDDDATRLTDRGMYVILSVLDRILNP